MFCAVLKKTKIETIPSPPKNEKPPSPEKKMRTIEEAPPSPKINKAFKHTFDITIKDSN